MSRRCIIASQTYATLFLDLTNSTWLNRYRQLIGFRAYNYECELEFAPSSYAGRKSLHGMEPGKYFVSQTFRTVAGKPAGPYPPLAFFKTEEERQAHVEAAKARFLKSREPK